MKRKITKANVIYVICTLILVWMIASWVDTITHNGNENPQYASWNMFALLTTTETETDSCTVVACCDNGNGDYRITVEDKDGNLWAYYDSGSREIGEEITPIWDNNEIVGLKGDN